MNKSTLWESHFLEGGPKMAWTKPEIQEIECGMEINMYGPEQDDEYGDLF